MLDIHGRDLQVVVVELTDERLKRECVPYDLMTRLIVYQTDSFLHIVIGNGIGSPAATDHQVMTEAAVMDDDLVARQVLHILYLGRLVLTMEHAVRENLDDGLSILSVVVMEMSVHAARHIGMSGLQVVQCLRGRTELNHVRDAELLEDEFQQVDIIAFRLAVPVEVDVRPQIPCIFINQRMILGKGLVALAFVCTKRDCGHQSQ